MTVVDAASVSVEAVSVTEAPEDRISHPAQAIGKVLAVPLLPGQAFARSSFATEGSGAYLASALARGKRAVSVGVKADSALESVLYPGCTVDVVASFSATGPKRQCLSATLLQGLQVLAVGRRTVFVPGEGDRLDQLKKNRRLIVTLMVDSRQAQVLQLAAEHGSISLALRNPTDTYRVPASVVSLDDVLRRGGVRSRGPVQHLAKSTEAAVKSTAAAVRTAGSDDDTGPGSVLSPSLLPDYDFPESTWDVVILRGEASETRSFPAPTSARVDIEERDGN
jgi:Flp pilus assembly protein CpaB